MSSPLDQAVAAETLATDLLDVYRDRQVPDMREHFASAGFTNTSLRRPDRLFKMLVLAAYDKTPFTGNVGGFEYIWGSEGVSHSLAMELERAGLFDLARVTDLGEEGVRTRLLKVGYANRSWVSEGRVSYPQVFTTAAASASGLLTMAVEAKASKEIGDLYSALMKVRGIGEVIASKVVKYLLREIRTSGASPAVIPLHVAWPIIDEYHNAEARQAIQRRLGFDVVPLTMGILLREGDPFAIDALFYMHRNHDERLRSFIEDNVWSPRLNEWAQREDAYPAQDMLTVARKVTEILQIIKEVCDDIGMPGQPRSLPKWVNVRGLQASGIKLMAAASAHARDNDLDGLYEYVQSCLVARKDMDDTLEAVGLKSLRSEMSRIENVYRR